MLEFPVRTILIVPRTSIAYSPVLSERARNQTKEFSDSYNLVENVFFSQQTSKLVLGMTTPVRNDARAALFATLIGCRSPTRCNSWTQCSDKHLNLFFSSLSISLSVSVGERVCLYVCVLCVLLNERGRCHCVCVRVS